MILASFKNKIFKPTSILRILMAVIFLTAGFFRVFNYPEAALELLKLGLPEFFTWFILVIEIGGGFLLLFNKLTRKVLIVFILFLIFALVNALIINCQGIISRAGELFVFDANPTDFFMHFVFLMILIFLMKVEKK
jgi:uncharacterized membrane protein YphA (DoxX/SURF4 family)